jgi:glycerophosphoryl diester phosphodiesterase
MRSRPLLLGHRGARATKSIPENTIASFQASLSSGCDGFEFDVRLTSDDRAVICHDAQIKGQPVALADASQLRDLPTLDDVLRQFSTTAFLDIELKVNGLEQKVCEAVLTTNPLRGYVVSSFQSGILKTLHAIDTELPIGLIADQQSELSAWRGLPIQFVIHKAGKEVFAWTVNEAQLLLRFAEWGVDALISDDTALLAATFRQNSKS